MLPSILRRLSFTFVLRGIVTSYVVLTLGAGSAAASLITIDPLGGSLIDFSQFNGGSLFTPGPLNVGGLVGEQVTFTSTNPFAVLGSDTTFLGTNGNWTGRTGFAGLNDTGTNYMQFAFGGGPVETVGAFMNYAPRTGVVVRIDALAADLTTILESYILTTVAPILTPGQLNGGAFRGIDRDTPDIYGFRVTGGFAVVDDLRFSRGQQQPPAIPEPGALALLLLGSTASLCTRRTWRRNRTGLDAR